MIINFVAVDLKGLFHGASIDRRSTILKPEKKNFYKYRMFFVCSEVAMENALNLSMFTIKRNAMLSCWDVSVVQQDINLFH